jgi:hypothetical protein
MYDIRPNTIIGFHGCDLNIRNKLVNDPGNIEISKKPYDWLGHGMYFWENNYTRALEWAEERKGNGAIQKPAVLGAVLQLGHCCDFLDSKFINLIRQYHESMSESYKIAGKPLPQNIDAPDDKHNDKLIRLLDCAAIEYMHKTILEEYREDMRLSNYSVNKLFDSTRGVFTEGGAAFSGSGLYAKSQFKFVFVI